MKFSDAVQQHIDTMQLLSSLEQEANQAAAMVAATLEKGGTIYICGNGGSASDAQHFAAELTGRFERDRRGYAAVALTTDTSALTAIANDYGFERIFARQLEALAHPGDLLIALSTSGNSPNILAVVEQAKALNCSVIGLAGKTGGDLKRTADCSLVIPSQRTSRIQEAHIFLLHYICEQFEPSA
jgi:D-sedoheptulose 7-phosphate isomerase